VLGIMDGMRARTAAAALVLAAAISLLCAGCTPMLACSGPGIPSPAVWLDASAWLAAHPGAELRACYGGRCQTVTADQPRAAQLIHVGTDEVSSRLLTVDSTAIAPLHLAIRLGLNSHTFTGGACGPVTTWGRNARLNADGTITVGRWNGEVPPPATATALPVPSVTP
jgi:hypothetical protein